MGGAFMGRIDKENYYLDIAQTVAGRSTCPVSYTHLTLPTT